MSLYNEMVQADEKSAEVTTP